MEKMYDLSVHQDGAEVKLALRETRQGFFVEKHRVISGVTPALGAIVNAPNGHASKEDIINATKAAMQRAQLYGLANTKAIRLKSILVPASALDYVLAELTDLDFEAHFMIGEAGATWSLTAGKVNTYLIVKHGEYMCFDGEPYVKGSTLFQALMLIAPGFAKTSKFVANPNRRTQTFLLVWGWGNKDMRKLDFDRLLIRGIRTPEA